SEEEVQQRVEKALRQTGCLELKDRAPFHLSGGQKKMASIATVLSMEPEILVFDEPTSGLDFAAEAQFIGIADRLPHSILMSTHDMQLARRLCTRAILMDHGSIAYDGPIDTLPYPLISTL
ncbi:MAG: ATP-binding cassette domain-containing protein, partial [Muribaculaceae bacterium]|nr:ATP-binding cassette domain-containing protein [Muribaculaceae bacterium]